MANARFKYMYRDGANYKKWGTVIFSNPEGVSLASIQARLQNAFLADDTFVADQIRIPEVFLFPDWPIDQNDHCLHEFVSLEDTSDATNDKYARSILAFVLEIETAAKIGWCGFTPGDEAKIRFNLPC
jgi:hypothetical protein